MGDGGAAYLGVDIGTSSCKVVAIDTAGIIVASASYDYPIFQPQDGWSEQDPQDWWEATMSAVADVCKYISHREFNVAGLGLTGQMHGLVALDDRGEVIRPAILWNDQRCADECDHITKRLGGLSEVISMTRNRLITGFTAGKVEWLRQHEPDRFSNIAMILNPKDYIRFKLTKEYATDVSDASGTGFFDVENRQWSAPLIEALGLTTRMLPTVCESAAQTGVLRKDLAEVWGLPPLVPVFAGGGDAVVQTMSMGIHKPGDIGITLGTAGIVATTTSTCPDNRRGSLQVSCNTTPGTWHIMGVSLAAAGAFQWLHNVLNDISGTPISFDTLTSLAESVSPGSDGLLFLPYLNGERAPHYAPEASAAWVGLTMRHGPGHLIRSVVEGALLNIREILSSFTEFGLPCDRIVASGGATRSSFWTQAMADILNREVVTLRGSEEGGAWGAALLAAIGGGEWLSPDAFFGTVEVETRFMPRPEIALRYDEIFQAHRRLFIDLQDVYKDLETIRGTR